MKKLCMLLVSVCLMVGFSVPSFAWHLSTYPNQELFTVVDGVLEVRIKMADWTQEEKDFFYKWWESDSVYMEYDSVNQSLDLYLYEYPSTATFGNVVANDKDFTYDCTNYDSLSPKPVLSKFYIRSNGVAQITANIGVKTPCLYKGDKYLFNGFFNIAGLTKEFTPTVKTWWLEDAYTHIKFFNEDGLIGETPPVDPDPDGGILDWLLSFFDNLLDFFISILVPSEGYFEDWFNEIKNAFEDKLGGLMDFIDEVTNAFDDIANNNGTDSSLIITLPDNWLFSGYKGISVDVLKPFAYLLAWIKNIFNVIVCIFTAITCYKSIINTIKT